ncbi:MAG TPA: hypothetical protein VFR24_24400 [Candidatus Angelobacter sp.]|nr:hypothetical protein [Candidatus Angelobacter sp.]
MESPLAAWENFYVIVGSSAGALTGLQFVVIALIAEGRTPGSMREVRAFGTPNIVHFGASLLISAILSAPWRTLPSAGFTLAICGAAGVVYAIQVIRHARLTTGYKPDVGDWMWYVVSPLILYSAWTASAILLVLSHTGALFAVAVVALLLLFVGIHNAWDSITYIALEHRKTKSRD